MLSLEKKSVVCLPPPPNKKKNKSISKLALPKHYMIVFTQKYEDKYIILHYRNLCFVTLYCITPHIILGTVRAIILSCINYHASFFGSKENLECTQSSTFSQQSLESIKAVYRIICFKSLGIVSSVGDGENIFPDVHVKVLPPTWSIKIKQNSTNFKTLFLLLLYKIPETFASFRGSVALRS